MISSHSNPKVKSTLRLRQSSERRKSGKFLIDGLREIHLAVAHEIRIDCVFYAGEMPELELPRDQLCEVSHEILAKLSYGQRGETPLAVAQRPRYSADRIRLDSQSLVLVLDQTEKPGNLGACLRTASACGASAVFLTNPICELLNPNTIRASRGTVFTLPIAECSPGELAAFCSRLQLPIWCARVDGRHSLWNLNLSQGSVLVFGNETRGLDASWDGLAAGTFSIPLHGAADSLNLSISSAVTLYEAVRQRRMPMGTRVKGSTF